MGAWVTAFLLVPAVAAPVVSPTEPASSISVDFRVIDERGRPVVDLRPEEVLIADDDSARTMSALRFVGAGDPDASRVIAFFLDEYHVAPADTTSVRQALRRFIEEYVEPTDHLVVLKPLESLGALQTMRGPRRVLEAVATFEGRRGDYSPRNAFERNYIAADAGRIDTVRAQIAVSALQALVTQVGRVTRNRKALVVVSEGFRVPIAGRGSGLPTIDSLIRSANQASVSLYPVEPVALRAGATASGGVVRLGRTHAGHMGGSAPRQTRGVVRRGESPQRCLLVVARSVTG